MKKTFIISTILLTCILFNTEIFSAPKRNASMARKRATTTKTNVSGTYNTATSTYTPTPTNITFANTSNATSKTSMMCGTPASNDNLIAKRLCANAYSQALDLYCKNTSCTSAIKVAMNMNFGIPLLSEKNEAGKIPVSIDVNDAQCYGDNLDKFCSNFAEELVAGLWPLYSAQAIRERKTCNFAKAKFNAAQECFNYILSEKNNTGLNNFFSTEKITEMDKEIDKICGKQAIIDNYEKISIDGWDENDNTLFFNESANTVSGKTGIGSNKKLSSSVATQFANVGTANWDISGKVGNFLDLNWDLKTSTYPRELTVLVNSFITDGETSCGSKFRTEMQDTSFEIEDKQSNLEREIAKKGLLKGLFDYSLNQASVIIGEDRANDIKGKGIVGSIADAVNKNKNKPTYNSQEKNISTLLTSCNQKTEEEFKKTEEEFKQEIENILNKINLDEKDIAKNYTNIIKDLTKIRDATEDKKYITFPEANDEKLIQKLEDIISELKNAKYTCEKGFKPKINEEKLTYNITYSTTPTKWDETEIKKIKEGFTSTILDNYNATNTKNWEEIEEIKTIIEHFKNPQPE
ncbi:MAG: hypothetical protein ACI4N3_04370 [Alphaproteobacteria bacterium]